MAVSASGMDNTGKPKANVPLPRSKRGIKAYINEIGREMKKVTWPTRAETTRLTGVVLGVCILIGAVMITMSWAFGVIVDIITKGHV
ncbi:MAG TPA: preprotein translocase subunit SecE [Fimbriimonas sp.]|nr:preprotein translocase subunit SecE [Fimbriimonas sp.]